MSGPSFGPSGLQIQTDTEIQAELAADLQAEFGLSLQALNGNAVVGQLVSALAQLLRAHQEGIDAAYQAATLEGAAGVNLDRLIEELGLTRNLATPTVVDATLHNSGVPAVTVPQGSLIQLSTGDLFATKAAVVVPGGGAAAATLRALVPAPLVVAAGSAWTLVSTFAGSSSITVSNAAAGSTGTAQEIDADLRVRVLQSAHLPGKGTVDAIRAAILDLDGVTYCRVFENVSIVLGIAIPVLIAGLPAKSFVAVVKTSGTSASVAATIFAQKPAGIDTYGSTAVNVQDADGFLVPIRFETATGATIWCSATVAGATAAQKAAIQAAVAAYINGLTVGSLIVAVAIEAAIFDAVKTAGGACTGISLLKFDTAGPPPVNTGNLLMLWNKYPTTAADDAHIALTFV